MHLSRRKSCDGQALSPRNLSTALHKISALNAFARSASVMQNRDGPETSRPSISLTGVVFEREGSLTGANVLDLPPDSPDGSFVGYVAQSPVSPWYGMYSTYEEVMDLLRVAIMADGGARRMLTHITREQLVHVAHLGLGACCTVDLVAVHCPGGERVLAAAKSCYLPPSDPRLRASLREAELLKKCVDCPFIMQLLGMLQESGLDAPCIEGFRSSGGGGEDGAGRLSPRGSAQLMQGSGSGAASAGYPGSPGSPGYAAWAQWRGGGTPEELQRQVALMQLQQQQYAGAWAGGSLSASFGAGASTGGVDTCGAVQVLDCPGSPRQWGQEPAVQSPGSECGSPRMRTAASCSLGVGTSGFGTCGAYGTGGFSTCGMYGTGGFGTCGMYGGGVGGRGRRSSMEVIEMYGSVMGHGGTGGLQGSGGGAGAGSGPGGGESPVMVTLLVGWARCGDLRRLVQLLLKRSPAHQPNKATGAAPSLASVPLLMAEEAARFYVGCLALGLEHLHTRLHTVHRDLKLANLLLLDSGYALIGDLGTAVDLGAQPGGRLHSRVGSPGHMAPEVQHQLPAGYDTAADMWSVGACMFALLTGQLPAGVAGPGAKGWAPTLSRAMSGECQGLLGRLLSWDAGARPSVGALMRDPWFRGFDWGALRAMRMRPPELPWRELLWWPREQRHLL